MNIAEKNLRLAVLIDADNAPRDCLQGIMAKRQLTRLRVFRGSEHPHQAQKPETYVEGGNE